MPISPRPARSAIRVAAPLSVAVFAATVAAGCPGGSTVTPPATDDGQAISNTGVATPKPSTPSPSGSAKATPTPDAVLTPRTTFTTGPQATIAPSSFFATPTPLPTVKAPPPLEPLGIELFLGATSSSPFALNQFRIRYGDNTSDTPDLPTRRTYSALLSKGLAAEKEGFLPGKYATESVKVDWSITSGTIDHSLGDTSTLPTRLAFFRHNGLATDSVRNQSTVSIETATISLGVLLTFRATVSISTDSTGVGTPKTSTAEILASSEGKADFEILSLDRRISRPARIVP